MFGRGRIMTITKKHLKELADIVYEQAKDFRSEEPSFDVCEAIKSFAQRHAPNFDESRWNDYMHKKMKAE